MKKFIALTLGIIMVLTFIPATFAQGIELDEIYDSYGYGEEIFVCGTSVTEGVVVSIIDSDGTLKYYVALDGETFKEGVYIGVDKSWNLGDYVLRVSYGSEYIETRQIEIVKNRVNHNTTTSTTHKTDITATDVSVSQTELEIEVGESVELTATGEKSSFKWTTDDDDKITIDGAYSAKAKISAKKTGTAVIWVYCGNNYATVTMKILPAKPKKEEPTVKPTEDKKEDEKKDEPLPDKFNDLENVPWAKNSINSLAQAGVINGIGDGIFAPLDNVTRAQFVKMIVEAFGYKGKGDVSFDDIDGSEWYAEVVLIGANNGIIQGYAGRFSPNDSISCQDAALIVQRVLAMKGVELPSAVKAPDAAEYAQMAVGQLISAGIIDDVMGFLPFEKATRAQSAYLIHGAYVLLQGNANG